MAGMTRTDPSENVRTLKDLARLAGVSAGTVSRAPPPAQAAAVSSNPPMSPRTRGLGAICIWSLRAGCDSKTKARTGGRQ